MRCVRLQSWTVGMFGKGRGGTAGQGYVATFESELAEMEETLNGREFCGFLVRLPGTGTCA